MFDRSCTCSYRIIIWFQLFTFYENKQIEISPKSIKKLNIFSSLLLLHQSFLLGLNI